MSPKPATAIEVDLDLLGNNFRMASSFVRPSKIVAVVKSEAYGHGAIAVSHHLSGLGCNSFAVATLDEGIQLRESGLRGSILLLGGQLTSEYTAMAEYGLTPTLSSSNEIEQWAKEASKFQGKLEYHIEVDLGLGRLGFLPWESREALNSAISVRRAAELTGVLGHLSSPSSDLELSKLEHLKFNEFASVIRSVFPTALCHVAASQAASQFAEMHHDLVRLGGVLYGLQHIETSKLQPFPIMTFRTQIASVKFLPEGWYLGYDKRVRLDSPRLVANLPIGWTDGLTRTMVGRAYFLVDGHPCSLLATYTDYSTVDVSSLPSTRVGQEVVVIGAQDGQSITAIQLAAAAQVSTGELLGKISLRVPRIYKADGIESGVLSLSGYRNARRLQVD